MDLVHFERTLHIPIHIHIISLRGNFSLYDFHFFGIVQRFRPSVFLSKLITGSEVFKMPRGYISNTFDNHLFFGNNLSE